MRAHAVSTPRPRSAPPVSSAIKASAASFDSSASMWRVANSASVMAGSREEEVRADIEGAAALHDREIDILAERAGQVVLHVAQPWLHLVALEAPALDRVAQGPLVRGEAVGLLHLERILAARADLG